MDTATTSKKFEELLVWQKAHSFVLEVYNVTRSFPKEEMYGLTSQFRRAAISVPANIAESFVKRGIPDKLRFYNISQGSLEECRYYSILSRDIGYTSEESLMIKIDEISRMLNSYISKVKL